jgi:hypothetical protein
MVQTDTHYFLTKMNFYTRFNISYGVKSSAAKNLQGEKICLLNLGKFC